MVDVPITIACGNYDRTKAIIDGRVKVEGCAVNYLPLYPEEIFHRLFKFQEFDVAEMSFSSYIRTVAAGTSDYIGIPAFVSRLFRHSGIYVRADAGIEKPEDLRGKRIGLPEYQITAVVWMRGMLQHEYGVKPDEIHWRNGGQEEAGRGTSARRSSRSRGSTSSRSSRTRRWSTCCATASSTRCSPRAAPSSFLRGEPHIKRLFPDIRATEKAYYKKTGLFPIMHLVGIRKSLVEQHPWLATSVYKAFLEAKALAMIDLLDVNALMVTLPWLVAETKRDQAVMGKDFWKYGVRREHATRSRRCASICTSRG